MKKKAAKAKAKAKPKAAAKKKVSPIPPGYHTVTPYLICSGASAAIDFYKKAFGAKELFRMPGPDGKLMHAEIKINDSVVMLGDEMQEMGITSPATLKGTAVHLMIYSKNVDKAFAQATAAGAKVQMPPADMFWGDRYCKLVDPYGHCWSIATHVEDVSPKEMARRGAEFMSQQAKAASAD